MILFILFEYNFIFLHDAFLILTTRLSHSIFLLPVSKPPLIHSMQCCCVSTLVSFSSTPPVTQFFVAQLMAQPWRSFWPFTFLCVSWVLDLNTDYCYGIVLPEEILKQIFVIILSRTAFLLVGLQAGWSMKESLTISSTVYDHEWSFPLLHWSKWSDLILSVLTNSLTSYSLTQPVSAPGWEAGTTDPILQFSSLGLACQSSFCATWWMVC